MIFLIQEQTVKKYINELIARKAARMRITENEKGMIVSILNRVYKNVTTGENSEMLSTDESLIFSFDEDSLKDLEKFIQKAAKEYVLE